MLWEWLFCIGAVAIFIAMVWSTVTDDPANPYSSWQTAPFEAMADQQKIVDPVGVIGGTSSGVHTFKFSQCGQCGAVPANHPACCLGVPGTKIGVNKGQEDYGISAYSPDGGFNPAPPANWQGGFGWNGSAYVATKAVDKKPEPVVQKDYTGRKFQ